MKESLHLPSKRTESLRIKTFGSTEERETVCEAVELGLVTSNGERLKLSALAVPFICDPVTSQHISYSRECYDHLLGLELADSADAEDVLEVDGAWSLEEYEGGEVDQQLSRLRLDGFCLDQLDGMRLQ